MKPVLSSHLFVRQRLTTVWLERVWDAGFPEVEIFCARQHIDYRDKPQINELRYWFRDSPLKIHSLHSPMYNDDVWGRSGPQSVVDITETGKAKRMITVDEIKRALEIADVIPFHYLIQHVGVVDQQFDERRLEAAFSSLEEIKVFAGQRGVEVLLENTPNRLATAEGLNYFLGETHLKLGYCFDVGHAHMTGRMESEFELMKSRIRSTHIHDNNGEEDEHKFPGEGSLDWKKAVKLLRSLSVDLPLVMELKEPPGMEHIVTEAKAAADRLIEMNIDEQ
ncbi:MAG TPA: sugar phosphate isomerase/epimerase family protein [Bryobacteraceae bacterium]|jgi:sugar phosphate isomerase/epimerase|nr:sugar phosphate isomerase/epimerase family protein [Bryobacteraceae bacterium]